MPEKYTQLDLFPNLKNLNASEQLDVIESAHPLSSETANDAILIFVDNCIVFHNKKAEKLTGYSSENLCRKHVLKLIHKDDRSSIGNVLAGEVESTHAFRLIDKMGENLWCQASFIPITWEQKSGILLTIRDLSPQKALESQLQQAQKMEALGTLVAGVAHEINNPVNLIMYNMPLLEKVWNDFLPILESYSNHEPAKKYGGLTFEFLKGNLHQLLSDIDMATNRIAKIVSDLKNFSKQSDISEKKPLNINSAVKNALRLSKSTLIKSRIAIETEFSDGLPKIIGNGHSIEQVILNIILNAVQAIDHDHGKIKITTGYRVKDGQVFITVSDNGPGINPELSDKIFDPFVTDKQDKGGTGLGLSVSYNLVKSHNGEITFKNLDEGGVVFNIFLPIHVKGKTYKILIADDDEMVREVLVAALRKNGSYLMDEALNGIEACIKLGSYQPDLLILDIMMPEMDGLEVCRTITRSEDLKDLKVMITTGHPEHPKVSEVKALGFTNISGKPIKIRDFLSGVDEILNS